MWFFTSHHGLHHENPSLTCEWGVFQLSKASLLWSSERPSILRDWIRKGFADHLCLSDHVKWLLELLPWSHILLLLTPPALPVRFQKEMRDAEATEGATATLQCELSGAASVEWRKKHKVLKASEKYTMRQEGSRAQLLIHALEVRDAGEYTCVCGEEKTTAALTVHGKERRNGTFLGGACPSSSASLSTHTPRVLSLILPSLILFVTDFLLFIVVFV